MENDTLDLIRPEKWHYFKDFVCWNSLLNKNYLPNEIMKYVYSYVLNDVKNMANNDIIKYKVLFHSLYNSKYFRIRVNIIYPIGFTYLISICCISRKHV